MDSFKLDPAFIKNFSTKQAPFGFNGLGELVYMRTYSRLKTDGTNEKWYETIQRVVEGTYNLQKKQIDQLCLGWNPEQAQASAQEMYTRMFEMKFLPPGRGLWAMGTDIVTKKGLGASLNNCGFISTKNIEIKDSFASPFCFTMDMSMLGVGVGFDTEGAGNFIVQSPNVHSNFFVVQDTREGWVDSLRVLLDAYTGKWGYNSFDYSQIRPIGIPLKTFGGVSSGPGPLIELHKKVIQVLDKNIGAPITVTTIVDIMNLIGKCVVSGNLRRCLPKGTLVHAQHGLIPIESVKPGTMVHTASGLAECAELLYQGSQEVITICTELGEFECTEKHKIAVMDSHGYTWKMACELLPGDHLVFPEHIVSGTVMTLDTIESFGMIGRLSGNISKGVEVINSMFDYLIKDFCKKGLYVPTLVLIGSPEVKESYLNGLYETNHNKTFDSIDFAKQLQALHASLGQPVKLIKNENNVRLENMNKSGKLTPIKFTGILRTGKVCETYDISVPGANEFIAAEGLLVHNTALISFGAKDSTEFMDLKDYSKNPHRMEYGWTSNNSIFAELGMDYTNVAERICINGEPGLAWLGNMRNYSRMCDPPDNKDYRVMGGNPCLEQSLEHSELCNLSENFLNRHDSLEDFLRTLKFSYLYSKTVTLCSTHCEETNRVQLRNRRIGCSVSGVAQFLAKHDLHTLNQWLNNGYSVINSWDKVYSEWLCIPRSIKMTSVKPSGTVSLLAGATPGMHYPESRFYIRRMRLSNISPLLPSLRDAGYPVEPCFGSENDTVVVEIPIDVGEGIRTVNDVSMWEQLSLAANMQRWWADNQVSCTITFNPKTEGSQIANALDYFQYHLKGISFLPKCDFGAFPQMPYEEITENEYQVKRDSLKVLKISTMSQDSEGEKYCDGDSCVRN
uniref:ribonucleoside-triphosphate reductase (thioredoxin) n=1 Tax=viral metagenome TaxID=1070528 RepID=A0A6C0I8P8_9ZZZZ